MHNCWNIKENISNIFSFQPSFLIKGTNLLLKKFLVNSLINLYIFLISFFVKTCLFHNISSKNDRIKFKKNIFNNTIEYKIENFLLNYTQIILLNLLKLILLGIFFLILSWSLLFQSVNQLMMDCMENIISKI